MTNQEAFDKSARHLLTQKAQALNPDYAPASYTAECMYRAPDGRRCAIGVFIPDDVYTPDMENKSVGTLITYCPAVAEIFAGVDQYLLRALQSVHDKSAPQCWLHALIRIAEREGLSTAVLEEFK